MTKKKKKEKKTEKTEWMKMILQIYHLMEILSCSWHAYKIELFYSSYNLLKILNFLLLYK
jgi:hypothetical protein